MAVSYPIANLKVSHIFVCWWTPKFGNCIEYNIMSTFVLAAFLVSLLSASGYAAIAYLFPQNRSQD